MRESVLGEARRLLASVFGYSGFRGEQADIVAHVAGGGDALVLMPTGGGKSLCYQLPALLRPGVGVVVSPLIALMKDQVDALLQVGVRAAFLNSSLSQAEARNVEARLRAGELDLLYVAPERLMTPRFLEMLESSLVALFAIDEAHCVSQWGHDFRPEYIGLTVLAERFAAVPRVALTATADAATRREMLLRLGLGGARQFVSSFDRPNIRYTVVDKQNAKEQFLAFYRAKHQGEAGIVYCLSRKSVDATAEWLRRQGVKALPYHAGLDAGMRARHQERFLREEGLVMVATIAFGMGIDKPDVRFVAHLDLPKSLEGYYQETGRAGRDGLPASALMTYGLGDVVSLRRMLASSNAPEEIRRVEAQKLEALLGFCESAGCRRQGLLGYFGETLKEPCGNCDTCLVPVETLDGTVAAQKALSTVYRTSQRFGAGHVIDVLLGKDSPRMRLLKHHALSTYGIGKELSEREWRSVLRQLVAAGLLSSDPEGHGSLRLTPKSGPILKGATFKLRRDPAPRKRAARTAAPPPATLKDADERLFAALRALRGELAREQGVPPYVVFHDSTLRALAQERPGSLAAMAGISGVGKAKLERYGQAFLEVVLAHGTSPSSPKPSGSELPSPEPALDAGHEDDEGDTVVRTLTLVLAGASPEEAAKRRALKLSTVESHLAELVRRGELTAAEATRLPEAELRAIEGAVLEARAQGQARLKPLYELFGGRYSYGVLRCVCASLGD